MNLKRVISNTSIHPYTTLTSQRIYPPHLGLARDRALALDQDEDHSGCLVLGHEHGLDGVRDLFI